MDIRQYLAEEIAIDYRDAHVSRREALHRLALLGLSSAAASTLLAACGGDATSATPSASASGSAPAASSAAPSARAAVQSGAPSGTPSAAPLPPSKPTEAITFDGPKGVKLQGAWASADQPKAGILVIHENKGLNDHTRQVAGRFAAAGYAALAIDLLSEEGGTASLGDVANATAALGKADVERFVPDMRAGIDEIIKRSKVKKVGAIGFCFGGGMTWRLIASKDERLAAAAPFYGPLPDNADFTGSKAAVLGVYAELDKRVNATREAAEEALTKAALVHRMIVYRDADHAFFNDTGPRYNAAAASEAWTTVLDWFASHLA
ncbi:MAG: dienelactone hydrolase family protein [Polyangiaceae bacterium]